MPDLITALPNLSIGVICVLALGYITINFTKTSNEAQARFIKTLEERADKHDVSMKEREQAMRDLEASVRTSMADQLTKNTVALSEVSKVLARVVRHFGEDD